MKKNLILIVALSLSSVALATDYPPQDHGGADLILADGDVIWGEHRNIGHFEVPSGATISVRPYLATVFFTGELSVFADDIVVSGTLTADGAGYTGGGGQGGQSADGLEQLPEYDGTDGVAGHPRYAEYAGSQLSPSGGDGSFGGVPSASDQSSRNGGYDAANGNEDSSEDTVVLIGSGGAGGYAGEPFNVPFGQCPALSKGGDGGGGGGPGGGSIALFARGTLTVSGTVLTTGAFGQPGDLGQLGYLGSGPPRGAFSCAPRGGNGGDGGDGERSAQIVAGAGAGAGGGCVLFCLEPGAMTVSGTVDGRGGEWRQGDPLDGVQNGGTVKLFFTGSNDLSGTITGGRTDFNDVGNGELSPTLPLLGTTTSNNGFDQNFDGIIDAADISVSTAN